MVASRSISRERKEESGVMQEKVSLSTNQNKEQAI